MTDATAADAPTKACPVCGEQILAVAHKCRYCGEYLDPSLKPKPSSIATDPSIRMLIPVGRSGWSIAAGYLGLFAVLPVFHLLALVVSIVALRDFKKRPELGGRGRAIFGLIMGIVFTLIYGAAFVPLLFTAS